LHFLHCCKLAVSEAFVLKCMDGFAVKAGWVSRVFVVHVKIDC